MTDGRKMIKRIPCTSVTHEYMKELTNGLGMNFDETLQFLISQVIDFPSADPLLTGRELREKAKEWRKNGYVEPPDDDENGDSQELK